MRSTSALIAPVALFFDWIVAVVRLPPARTPTPNDTPLTFGTSLGPTLPDELTRCTVTRSTPALGDAARSTVMLQSAPLDASNITPPGGCIVPVSPNSGLDAT